MRFSETLTNLFIATMIIGMISSCGDSSTSTDPGPDESTNGTIEVKTSTSNSESDDGYTVTLNNDASKTIENNGEVTFIDLEEGSYTVELTGLADGCTVGGDNPVTVSVTAGETASAAFQITCEQDDQTEATGTIVYQHIVDQKYEIFSMNADGTGKQKLTDNSTQNWFPSISPDGTQIVFTRNGIWLMDIDGSNAVALTNPSDYEDRSPHWSSDGSRIVFVSDREDPDRNRDLYVMNSDGSDQTRLTTDAADDENPDWSPDGNQIVFESDRDGNGSNELYLINADGTGLTQLLDDTDENGINLSDPAWSPDGSKIAYQGYITNGAPKIFIVNSDGSDVQMVPTETFSAFQPDWSPDGVFITYVDLANGDTTDTIWIVKTDGSDALMITDDQGTRSSFPSWGITAP